MHFTIIKIDNSVGVDGVFYTIDCSELPENFWALQWTGPTTGIGGAGEVEFTGYPKPPNEPITDLGGFYAYYEAWEVEDYNHKHPDPPPEIQQAPPTQM
jgi:hypothetical protein